MKIALKLIFLLFYSSITYSQNFSKNTLKYNLGIGVYDSYKAIGDGGLLIIGYQRELWNDRFRLNPGLNLGTLTPNISQMYPSNGSM
jgi:hypothetical protein